jgi:hypothetical protein
VLPPRPLVQWSLGAALAAALVLGPLAATLRLVDDVAPARAYGASWDALDATVRAAQGRGARDVTVRPLPPTGLVKNLDFIGPNRDDWFNTCVANYYDVRSIAAE